jgi:hypothetical protein
MWLIIFLAIRSSPWRTTTLNTSYGLCSSYPRYLIVPAGVTDNEVEACAMFRSGQRLPVLCWGTRHDSSSIWRSSQPKARSTYSRSAKFASYDMHSHNRLLDACYVLQVGVSATSEQDQRYLDVLARVSVVRIHPDNGRQYFLPIIDCRPRANAMANRAAGAGYESTAR